MIKFIKNLWFELIVKKRLMKQANSKYRVVQKSETSFEIQWYQNCQIISRPGNTGYSNWNWMPMVFNSCTIKEDYIKQCYLLRHNEYTFLVSEYLKKKEKPKKKIKYPQVIY